MMKVTLWSLAVCVTGMFVVVFLFLPFRTIAFYSRNNQVQVDPKEGLVKYSGASPSNGTDELVVLLHVSDIHVSRFTKSYEKNLEAFCTDIVPAVDPAAVFATGDLVDGYGNPELRGGAQQLEEWTRYQEILNTTGMLAKPFFWNDVRGNHDGYGAGAFDDLSSNLYETFGVSSASQQGRADKRAWKLDIPAGSQTYRFVGYDSSVEVGLAKPFNYFGALSKQDKETIQRLLEEEEDKVALSVLVSHHPESQINGGLGSSIRDKAAYSLCGHVHVDNMKLRYNNMIELELDDLKLSRRFRVIAIDHGVFSFSDVSLDDAFPIGVITNPKEATFKNSHEPAHEEASTHVRILALTSQGESIVKVSVYFDGKQDHPLAGEAVSIGKDMYALEWSPKDYFKTGLHSMHVTIVDSKGRTRVMESQFSLDGSTASFGWSRYQVEQALGDSSAFIYAMLGITTGANLLHLFISKERLIAGVFCSADVPKTKMHIAMSWFILISALVLSFGPFLIGRFVTPDGPFSLAFPFGVIVLDGTGFALDTQAGLFALIFQVGLLLPFLTFLELYSVRRVGGIAEALTERFSFGQAFKRLFFLDLDWTGNKFHALLRNTLPFFLLCFLIIMPLVLALVYFGFVTVLVLSPSFWYGPVYFLIVFRLLGAETEDENKEDGLACGEMPRLV